MTEIVRTPTKASGGITEAEKVLLKEHTDRWIKMILRTEPTDFSKLKPAIEGLYGAANLPIPVVALARSPIAMVFMYGAASAILKKKKKAPPAQDVINTVVEAFNAVDASKTNNLVQEYVSLTKKLAGAAGITEAKQWSNVYQGGAYWAQYDVYLTAMRDVIGLRLPEHEKYKYWEEAAIHGTFRVMHEKFCIVTDFPDTLKMDDQNRAHCQNGPSHRWSDGWALYHWHGVAVPEHWIMNPASLSAKEAITWTNIEERRAACEILGWAKILKELKAKVIDSDGDPEIGELLEVTLPDIGTEKFLRVMCGTGREFALPVPPEMTTALEANAWTYGLSLNEFVIPEVRT
jgi:hypothetical protein